MPKPEVVSLNCPNCGATFQGNGKCQHCGSMLMLVGDKQVEVDPAKENEKQNLALLNNWRQRVENEGETTVLVHYNNIDKLNWSGWSIKQVLERCGFWRQGWDVGENMPLSGNDTNNPVAYYVLENLKYLAEDDSVIKSMFERLLENYVASLNDSVVANNLTCRSSADTGQILLVAIASFRSDLVGQENAQKCEKLCGQINPIIRASWLGL